MKPYTLLPGLVVATTLASTTATAQSAHLHGEGRVNVAIDGDRLFMALESAGADIVGFEHMAHSAAEKQAVANAIAQLGEPMQMLRLTPAAGCETVRASAAIDTGEHGHDDQHHDDEHHESHDDKKPSGSAESHSAFTADYEIHCADIDALVTVEFAYFQHFANAQSLDIVLIDDGGQRRVEVDRSDPVLRLAR